MDNNIHSELNAGTTFDTLCEKRKIVANLYDRLGKWLAKFNRYNQLAEDYYREQMELISTADILILDVEQRLDQSKTDNLNNSSALNIRSEIVEENSDNEDGLKNIVTIVENLEPPNEELNKEVSFKGLSLLDAIKMYLAMFSEKLTVKIITDGLKYYGFDGEIKHLYESIRSTLRYYEKKGVFERDGAIWGLANDENTENVVSQTKFDTEPQSPKPAETKVISEQKLVETKITNSGVKSNTQYCKEILQKSGVQWLHVDQFLAILKKDYGIIRRKEIIAAALRKNSNNKNKIFKSYGGNRFGLLEDQTLSMSAASSASVKTETTV